MRFDLLIKGGIVVDPAAGYNDPMDVGITRNRIAAVDYDIPPEAAFQVFDARGQYITPGLIDLHAHVYHSVTYWGVNANTIGPRSGVTTWLDVGSAGAYNLRGFRDFIVKPADVRIYALLNISSIGLTASNYELATLEFCDVELCTRIANANRDLVLGIKVRMGTPTIGASGIEPMRRARQAADACAMPLMLHVAEKPPGVEEVLPFLKAGDILTHCFTGLSMKIVDEQGRLLDSAKRALDRGVIFDIGHGAGSFSFKTAEALMSAGIKPDVISTDIHQVSINGPLYDMPTCLSKFLYLGMSFPEVILAATARPAAVLGLQEEIGTLKPGTFADIALFTIEQGRFPFYDIFMESREGKHLIRNTLTIANGRPLPAMPLEPPASWIELTNGQQELMRRGHTPDAMSEAAQAVGKQAAV